MATTNNPGNTNTGMSNPDTGRAIDRDDNDQNKNNPDRNPDPITGAPGSHPVGTGIGAAAAGAAGAAIGSVVPGVGNIIGGVVGAVVGAVAGGYAGKGVAEAIDPTTENTYWQGEYRNRKYYDSSLDYDNDMAPAYRYGWESYNTYGDRPMEERESDLRSGWDKNRGKSRLDWDRAQHAVRDSWERLKNRTKDAVSSDDTSGRSRGGAQGSGSSSDINRDRSA